MKRPWKQYIAGLATAGLIGLICGFSYAADQPEVIERQALTITIAVTPLPNESSSYELQRAAEHFSDMVLGWTVAPGFELESGAGFEGRRQEKQNLMFFVESDDPADAEELLSKVNAQIENYNQSAGVEYKVALSEITEADLTVDSTRSILGAFLAALLVASGLIFAYDTYRTHRR